MNVEPDTGGLEYRSGGLRIEVAWRTDIGLRRSENQDDLSVSIENGRLGMVVCDGMGGHAAGSVASGIAVREFVSRIKQDSSFDGDQVQKAVDAAGEMMRLEVAGNPDLAGMGTTLAAVWVEGGRALIAHVGDSRVYRLGDGGFKRLTDDHSLVFDMVRRGEISEEEAAVHPRRNIITRALDGTASVRADISSLDLRDGDRLLICTDGLNGMVDDARIERLLASNRSVNAICDSLVEAALEGGGTDNVTVIVARVEFISQSGKEPDTRPGSASGGGSRFWLGIGGWKPLMLVTGTIAVAVIVIWYVWFEPVVNRSTGAQYDTTLIDTSGMDSDRQRAVPSWEGEGSDTMPASLPTPPTH